MKTMNKRIEKFINYWRTFRSCTEIDIESWFRIKALEYKDEEVFYISERMLQTYLFLNIEDIFPECKELILYERPLFDKHSTQFGKFDFLFLTKENKLMVIETKIIGSNFGGKTERTKRTKKRRKIKEQLIRDKRQLISLGIPEELVLCRIFATDNFWTEMERNYLGEQIQAQYISTSELEKWIENICNSSHQFDIKKHIRIFAVLARGWP